MQIDAPPIGTVSCRKPLSFASQARQSKPVRQCSARSLA
jgi:hypothetical protein